MYNIAIVDDNWEICELFKVMLENLEIFKVVSFENGNSFYEYIYDDNNIDVAIIDVDLPDISGFDIIKFLRKKIGASLPIMVVSAFEDFNHKMKALELGADDYIAKPLNMFEVVLKINNYLKKRKFVEQLTDREGIMLEKAEMLLMFEDFLKQEIMDPIENYIKETNIIKKQGFSNDNIQEFLESLDNKLTNVYQKIEDVLEKSIKRRNEIDEKKKDLKSFEEIENFFDSKLRKN